MTGKPCRAEWQGSWCEVTRKELDHELTKSRVAKLSASYIGINLTPAVITNGPPCFPDTDLHTATAVDEGWAINQSDATVLANSWKVKKSVV